jgi:dCMP deaminase
MSNQRPSWNENFIEMAHIASKRSNCIKRKVGSIITKNNRIISTGYNGTPHSIPNCFDGGCKRCNDSNIKSGTLLEFCICLHAEENAILHAKEDLKGGAIYCTHKPCLGCLKRIIQVGITDVYFSNDYTYSDEVEKVYLQLVEWSGINITLCSF